MLWSRDIRATGKPTVQCVYIQVPRYMNKTQDMISDHSHEMSSSDRHSSSDGISYSDIAQEVSYTKGNIDGWFKAIS